MNASTSSVATVELHISPNQHFLVWVLLHRIRENKDFQPEAKNKLAASRGDELCPDRVHLGIVRGVIFQMEKFTAIL
jgi:hypothetical protein